MTEREDGLSILAPNEIEELEGKVRFYTTRQGPRLAFHEYGEPDGRPVFFYHGTGSHLQAMLLHKPALRYGFRIISPDRPGWTVLEYARDMADLADHLGIDSFGAVGISGGGPTLLASAFAIPERLRCVVDLACAKPVYGDPEMLRPLGTMDRFYARMGTRLPLAAFRAPFWVLGMMQKVLKSPKSFAKMFDSSLCPADKEIFKVPDFQYIIMRDQQELFRHGSKGPAYDAQTVYKQWGFDLKDIKAHIEVIHGTADKFIPRQFSEYLARNARDVHINFLENQGHFYHLAYGYETMKKVEEVYH